MIYVPTLMYGQEWAVNERVRSSVIQEELRLESLSAASK